LRVLTILHSETLGGAEKHTITLMNAMEEKGHNMIFAGVKNGWITIQSRNLGLKTYNIRMRGFYDMTSVIKLAYIIKKEKIDLIHGHLTRGAYYAGILSKLTGTPSLATAHSTNASKHFGMVNHIIAVSNAVKQFLINSNYDEHKITRIYNGINDLYAIENKKRNETRISLNLKNKDISIALIGRFIKDKAQDIAVKAIQNTQHKNITLFFAGNTHTKWGKKIKNMVNRHRLNKRVIFLDEVDNVYPLLAAMDIVIIPSRRESFSLSLLEAISMKKAVIASSVGGIPEIIKDKESGLLVAPNNPKQLSKAIDTLIENPILRNKLAESARNRFLELFTLNHMIDATEQIYKNLIKRGSHGRY